MHRVLLVLAITDSGPTVTNGEVEMEHLPRAGDHVLHNGRVWVVETVGYPTKIPVQPIAGASAYPPPRIRLQLKDVTP